MTSISITIGGKEVRFTRSGNNVTFVLSGDATVAATAFAGITVNAPAAGSNFTIDKSSVHINSAGQTLELTPNEHCSWANPVNVVVTYGNDNITSQCAIVESGGKQVITLPALNDGSKAITVTATAVVNQHITVTFPTNRANMVIKHGNDELTGNSVDVYSDMLDYAITFEPAEGCMWTRVTPQATGGTMTNDGDVYTLVISASDTSDITVTAVTQSIPKYNITLPSTNVTAEILKGGAGSGKVYGGEVIVKLTPDEGYRVSVDSITMGNLSPATLVEGTDYTVADNNGVKTVTINNVNGDVVISASATNVNTAFKNVVCWKQSVAPARSMRYGNNYDYITSPLVDISDCTNVTFNSGEAVMALFLYDSDRNYKTFFNSQSGGRTVDVTNYSYARISCKTTDKDSAFIKDANSGDVLWSGSEIADASLLPGAKDWEDSPYSIQPNENGDYIGRAFANDAGNMTASGTNIIEGIDGASPNPFSLSKKIRCPKDGTEGKSNITFGTGGTKNNSGGLALYDENGNKVSYYSFNDNPRTVEVDAQYFECAFMFPTGDYETAYIINANTGELLWGTAPTETNE